MRLETVRLAGIAPVVTHGDGQKMVLDVWPFKTLVAADEAACFKVIGRAQAGSGEQPLRADGRFIPPLCRRRDGHGLRAFVLHVQLQMVLQIIAHAR